MRLIGRDLLEIHPIVGAARRRAAPFEIISQKHGAFCCGAGGDFCWAVSLKGFDLAAFVAMSTEADAVVGTSVF